MESFRFNVNAFIVGSKRHEAIKRIINFCTLKGISHEAFENIYPAMAMIAKAPAGSKFLVASDFVPLSNEMIRFISSIPKNVNVRFCCIMEKTSEPVRALLQNSARNEIVFIQEPEELLCILHEYKIDRTVEIQLNGNNFASRISSIADNFFLTEAEQNALLGEQSDESLANSE